MSSHLLRNMVPCTILTNSILSDETKVKDHDFYFNFYSSLQNQ